MRPPERFPHDDPREWLNRVHSNLARAKLWTAGVYPLVEEAGVDVPAELFEAATLTRYAAVTRYPGHTRPVIDDDHHKAVELASRVVRWVEGIL